MRCIRWCCSAATSARHFRWCIRWRAAVAPCCRRWAPAGAGEAPSARGWGGIALLIAGIGLLSRGGQAEADPARQRAGDRLGLTTGACIAAYTLVDGVAVKTLAMRRWCFMAIACWARSVLLAPLAWATAASDAPPGADHWRAALLVGVLSPLAMRWCCLPCKSPLAGLCGASARGVDAAGQLADARVIWARALTAQRLSAARR